PELARTLNRARQLALVTAAATGHASRADLALLGELAANPAEVLVVDDVDLVPAIRAGLAPACAGRSLAITAAVARAAAATAGLLPAARFTCHLLRSPVTPKKVPAKQGPRGVYRAKSRSTACARDNAAARSRPALRVRARDQAARLPTRRGCRRLPRPARQGQARNRPCRPGRRSPA